MPITKRQKRLEAQRLLKKPEDEFKKIDIITSNLKAPSGMTRAYRNNRYTVMIYDHAKTTHGEAIQVLIQNHSETPIINHWAEIQRIKNIIFGKESMAIEYFPAESELINTHNIYWIFIYPEGVIPKIIR